MAAPLNVLLVEDCPDDAALLLRELQRAGFDPHWERVETESDYLAHLEAGFDLILADYSLHQFNAPRALELLHERGLDIPFIIISGLIGEEEAVECMKHGASDYLFKDRLAKLGQAITHALDKKRFRDDMQYAEQALLESQRSMETLMSNLPGMAYRSLPKPHWTFTYASEGCHPLTGYQPTEFIQDKLAYADFIHPDDVGPVLKEIQTATQNRTPFQVVYRIRTASREEKWVWERGQAVFSANEQLAVEGFVTDITERKRAEIALAELSQQHQLILNSAGEGIYGLDLEGNTTFLNPAATEMIGYRIDELIGRPQHDFIHHTKPDGSPYPRKECLIYAALRDGAVHEVDTEVFWRKDGTSFPVAYTSTPIRDEDSKLVGAVVTFRDITERKRLEEQLRQAVKMEAVGRLAGGVAHDFNNLLTVISAYSQLLLLRGDLSEPLCGYAEEIREAGNRAAALTRQLLAFSRQEIVQPKAVDLNDLVTKLVKMLRRLIGENICLATNLAPSLGLVKVDPGQLEQVIVNLAVNARDAMPDGGTLTFETANVDRQLTTVAGWGPSRPASAVQLIIRDTGHGMDTSTRSRIFEPFFTTKEIGKGTGLGLATVYGIVTQCGGTVQVDSAPGEGTTFTIQLPRIEVGGETIETPMTTVSLRSGTETVLVVEDESVLRRLVRTVLTECGYQVLEAANGEHAKRLCQAHSGPIHLLLADLVMPGINGRSLAGEIAALRPSIKVLFMSGYSGDDVFRLGVEEGSAPFLRKPFTADTLAEAVRQVLSTESPRQVKILPR